eukprot:Amastigsp_a784_199.p2 type:complete len:111 gc:universal Amastigsp_a784_199:383-51(-)
MAAGAVRAVPPVHALGVARLGDIVIVNMGRPFSRRHNELEWRVRAGVSGVRRRSDAFVEHAVLGKRRQNFGVEKHKHVLTRNFCDIDGKRVGRRKHGVCARAHDHRKRYD